MLVMVMFFSVSNRVLAMEDPILCIQRIEIDLTEPKSEWAEIKVIYEIKGDKTEEILFLELESFKDSLQTLIINDKPIDVKATGFNSKLPPGKRIEMHLRKKTVAGIDQFTTFELDVPILKEVKPIASHNAAEIELRIPSDWIVLKSFPALVHRSTNNRIEVLNFNSAVFIGKTYLKLGQRSTKAIISKYIAEIWMIILFILIFTAIVLGIKRTRPKQEKKIKGGKGGCL
jgi:hypothetical protein